MRMRVWNQSYNNLEIASNAAAFKVRCTSANLAMDGLRETWDKRNVTQNKAAGQEARTNGCGNFQSNLVDSG